MIKVHPEKWTRQFNKVLQPVLKSTEEFLEHDMMDSKWGHRVLDQVFREGKFSDSKLEPSIGKRPKEKPSCQ